jgi:hypothetical protein
MVNPRGGEPSVRCHEQSGHDATTRSPSTPLPLVERSSHYAPPTLPSRAAALGQLRSRGRVVEAWLLRSGCARPSRSAVTTSCVAKALLRTLGSARARNVAIAIAPLPMRHEQKRYWGHVYSPPWRRRCFCPEGTVSWSGRWCLLCSPSRTPPSPAPSFCYSPCCRRAVERVVGSRQRPPVVRNAQFVRRRRSPPHRRRDARNHAKPAARCPREAVVRRLTSTSRGSACASSGLCSRPAGRGETTECVAYA